MTPMAEFLRQIPRLRRRALASTNDTNAAYMMVHNLVVGAMGKPCASAHDADLALTRAIAARDIAKPAPAAS